MHVSFLFIPDPFPAFQCCILKSWDQATRDFSHMANMLAHVCTQPNMYIDLTRLCMDYVNQCVALLWHGTGTSQTNM